MTKQLLSTTCQAGLLLAALFVAMLTLSGCGNQQASQPAAVADAPVAQSPAAVTVQMQPIVVIQDDYDYFPAYEVYYSRNRHEYLYRDGNQWVRRPEPRGVSLRVLLGSPSVRMDFRDSPEQHHGSIIQKYPKNWHQPAKDPHRDPKKNERDDGKNDDRTDVNRKN